MSKSETIVPVVTGNSEGVAVDSQTAPVDTTAPAVDPLVALVEKYGGNAHMGHHKRYMHAQAKSVKDEKGLAAFLDEFAPTEKARHALENGIREANGIKKPEPLDWAS